MKPETKLGTGLQSCKFLPETCRIAGLSPVSQNMINLFLFLLVFSSFLLNGHVEKAPSFQEFLSNQTVYQSIDVIKGEYCDPPGSNCSYTYQDHPYLRKKLVVRREQLENRYLALEYYSDPLLDIQLGKVKALYAPAGSDPSPILLRQFKYAAGATEVLNTKQGKTIYRYSPDQKLTAIEDYLDESGAPYRIKRFYWQQDRLVSTSLEGQQGIAFCCCYEYNSQGQRVKETLYGNLSGQCSASLKIQDNGAPVKNGIESYSKTYTYSADLLLMEEQGEQGGWLRYAYDSVKRLIAKYTGDASGILIRQFYEYNPQGFLIKEIVDDGCQMDVDDLTDVTERRIVAMDCYHSAAAAPQVFEERCLNFQTGNEELLKKSISQISPQGRVLRQEVFDSLENLACPLEYAYDSAGHVAKVANGDGTFIHYGYDLCGNQVKAYDSSSGTETLAVYDFMNRKIKQVLKQKGELDQTSGVRYDYEGNRIASSDSGGNETLYAYDALNRLIRVEQPCTSFEAVPITQYTHDIQDCIVSVVDPNGHKTVKEYNARGKPSAIFYPDGTHEKFTYNLDGSLFQQTGKNGDTLSYQYDSLGRCVKATVADCYGTVIDETIHQYDPFHLRRTQKGDGETIDYFYDAAGREILQLKQNYRVETFYDSMGRVQAKKEWYGPEESSFILTRSVYDAQGKISEVVVEDAYGNQMKQLQNKMGAEDGVNKAYVINQRGQRVLQKWAVNASGISTHILLDPFDRVEIIEKKDPMGLTFEREELCYDPAGNKIRHIYSALKDGKIAPMFTVGWVYGPMQRIEEKWEQAPCGDKKSTKYLYGNGVLAEIIKPDGTCLKQTFDHRSRLLSIESTDRTIHYCFHYDAQGRLVKSTDLIRQAACERYFEADKNPAGELLQNGLKIGCAYDQLGRRTALFLPDQTSCSYEYEGLYLKAVCRRGIDHQERYRHEYSAYDDQGYPLEAQLIGNLGKVAYERGSAVPLKKIESPYWSAAILEEEHGNPCAIRGADPLGSFHFDFSYDAGNQVTREIGEFLHTFTYDTLKNRVAKDNQCCSYNPLNQLIHAGEASYVYDPNGNPVQKKAAGIILETYSYDAFNRLVEVVFPGKTKLNFHYDPFHRRVAKEKCIWHAASAAWELEEKVSYIYDGMNEIGLVDSEGHIQELRVLGAGFGAEIGAAIAIELKSEIFAPIHDLRGSVAMLVDIATKKPAEFYRFSAFGEEKIFDSQCLEVPASALGNPWRYQSKRSDAETGLIFFGRRYYAPMSGRWISPDPLGFVDGANLYAFTLNNPLYYSDFYGLASFFETCKTLFNRTFDSLSKPFMPFIDAMGNMTRKAFLSFSEVILGKGFMETTVYHKYDCYYDVYGQGEVADNVRVTMINGMMSEYDYVVENIRLLSESHGNVNVHYIYLATYGKLFDVFRALPIKLGYISPYAYDLAALWRKLIDEMGGIEAGGTIVHYAHSIGGTETGLALKLLSSEEQKMIQVYTFGSATMVSKDSCQYLANFVSVRDGVCLFDPFGYIKGIFSAKSPVSFVGTFKGYPLIDHYFMSESYQQIWSNMGKSFVSMYGML